VWKILPTADNPRSADNRRFALTSHRKINHKALTKFIAFSRRGFFGQNGGQNRLLQFFRIVSRDPQRRDKDASFVPAARMTGTQAVVTLFFDLNNGTVSVWQFHL